MENSRKNEEDLGTKIEKSLSSLFGGNSGNNAQDETVPLPTPPIDSEIRNTQILSQNPVLTVDVSDESTLKVIASIILFIGIVCTFVLLFTIVSIEIPGSDYLRPQSFISWTGLVICASTLMSSIGLYFFLIVVGNISISLKEIKHSKTL